MLKSMFTFKNIAVIILVLFSSLLVLNFSSDGSSSGNCSSGNCSDDGADDGADDDGSDDDGSDDEDPPSIEDGVYTGVKKRDTSPPRPPSTTPSGFDDLRNQTGAVDLPLPDLSINLEI